MEQPHKIMGEVGPVVPWIQLFGQSEERVGVVMEEVDLKYGLCVGQVVLLQVVIETATRRPVEQTCADSGGSRAMKTELPFHLKSGMPLGVLMPAPAITTTLR